MPTSTGTPGKADAPAHAHPRWVLAVHGGAGDGIMRLRDDRLQAARAEMAVALRTGADVLRQRGPAVEAVVEAVKVLEDSPLFNAGRGSVLTVDGTVETDAAVADGHTRRAGAVAACRRVRNPVEAAHTVMVHTDHVLLAGDAVAALAEKWGLELEDEEWFVTPEAREQTRRASGETVGSVALDLDGHLAAATSTGGRPGQLPGRVGDSPLVGAGVWADDATCAVSATGRGESFVLAAFAHEIDALIRLSGAGLAEACDRALQRVLAHGDRGGCIALTRDGELAMPFTSAAMFRGWTDASAHLITAVTPADE